MGDFRCYNLEEFKLLLKLDLDFDTYKSLTDALNLKTQDQDIMITDLNNAILKYQSNADILQTENLRITKLWEDENKKRHDAENVPKLSASFGWTTAAIFIATTATLGIAYALK